MTRPSSTAERCERAKIKRWRTWMTQWQQHFVQIIDQPHPNLRMDPHWVEFYLYKVRITPGAVVDFQVRITNHEATVRNFTLRFRTISGVQLDPLEVNIAAPPNQVTVVAVTARFPTTFVTHSLPIVADVTWHGRHLGEMVEAIAYW